MTRRLRVLHAITRLELGGAQQNTLYCVRHHDRRRFEVELLAGAGGQLDAEAVSIPDARISLVPWLEHAIAPARDIAAVPRLLAFLRRGRFDVVHTHSSKAGLIGRIAAHLAGVPAVVHTVHGWSFNETQTTGRRGLYVGLERCVAPLADRLLVVADANREAGLRHGIGRPAQYRTLHSGVDIGAFAPTVAARTRVREELGFGPRDVVVGMVGNFKPQKAPVDFVEAAALAHRERPELRFFVAGDGELRPAVEASIRNHGLESVVRLLGWRDDVPALYSAMDVFALTSLFEGLPRAVLQAFAAGVPVAATAVDGTPDVVVDGVTGLLAPPSNPAAFAERLVRLASDADLRERFAARARRSLDGRFDIARMVRDLEEIYLQSLDASVGRRDTHRA